MNKSKIILTLISFSLILLSCSSDDDSANPEPETVTNKLVKSEKISDTRQVSYTYNTDDLISRIRGSYSSFDYSSDFMYNSDNKLTTWDYSETGSSTYSDTYTYTYNSNGLLSAYTANTENVTIIYNGNTATLSGQLEGDTNAQAILELNADGLVIKFTESDNYTIFGYDANDNLISAKAYDNTDELLAEYTLEYDNHVNPFYGQLQSIYIERFIEFFWEFDGIYIGGFEGYNFPYTKNNITSITKTGGDTTNLVYSYDTDNYPIRVNADYSGTTLLFDIEYY
ncbi:MAG: hypothetical protein COA80_14110 [Leeuwenhoekiella sp.]|nr:MAG: hypothetical protein COA80_14110 [Leeuwenhoekiella sp.]